MTTTSLHCNDTFSEQGVTCPVCGVTDATVTFLVWCAPGTPTEDTVIDFECGNHCWRPWGPSNDLIGETFSRIEA